MLHTRLFFFLFLRIFKIVIVSIGSFYLSNSCHAAFCASQWHSWSTCIPIEKYFIRLTFWNVKGWNSMIMKFSKIENVSIVIFYLSNGCHTVLCAVNQHSWSPSSNPIKKYLKRVNLFDKTKVWNYIILKFSRLSLSASAFSTSATVVMLLFVLRSDTVDPLGSLSRNIYLRHKSQVTC